jgi:RHS repeat-associated protein
MHRPSLARKSGCSQSDGNALKAPASYGYTGRQFDSESGLYYDRARPYNPATGRFNNTDPSGLGGGDYNLYRYTGNNPINLVDPSGRGAISTAIFRIISGIFGLGPVGFIVGVIQDNAGNIGGKPLDPGEDFTSETLYLQNIQTQGLPTPPQVSFIPEIDPTKGATGCSL